MAFRSDSSPRHTEPAIRYSALSDCRLRIEISLAGLQRSSRQCFQGSLLRFASRASSVRESSRLPRGSFQTGRSSRGVCIRTLEALFYPEAHHGPVRSALKLECQFVHQRKSCELLRVDTGPVRFDRLHKRRQCAFRTEDLLCLCWSASTCSSEDESRRVAEVH